VQIQTSALNLAFSFFTNSATSFISSRLQCGHPIQIKSGFSEVLKYSYSFSKSFFSIVIFSVFSVEIPNFASGVIFSTWYNATPPLAASAAPSAFK